MKQPNIITSESILTSRGNLHVSNQLKSIGMLIPVILAAGGGHLDTLKWSVASECETCSCTAQIGKSKTWKYYNGLEQTDASGILGHVQLLLQGGTCTFSNGLAAMGVN
jgi:hypothetical protein